MRRTLLFLFGLVCLVMAFALPAPDDIALTPLVNTADQTATLAIQPAPMPSADNVGTITQVAMLNKGAPKIAAMSLATQSFDNQSAQLALSSGKTAVTTSSRSMPLKISVTTALNTVLITDDKGTTNARAPNVDTAALTNYPNPFNSPTSLVTALNTAETTPMAASAWATDGGQPQCRAVIALASPVGTFVSSA